MTDTTEVTSVFCKTAGLSFLQYIDAMRDHAQWIRENHIACYLVTPHDLYKFKYPEDAVAFKLKFGL